MVTFQDRPIHNAQLSAEIKKKSRNSQDQNDNKLTFIKSFRSGNKNESKFTIFLKGKSLRIVKYTLLITYLS